MLSIFLTQDLEKSEQVLYYFCRAEDISRKSAAYVLRSLLWQLSIKQPRLADHVLQYLDTAETIAVSTTSTETLWTMFASISQDPILVRLTFPLTDWTSVIRTLNNGSSRNSLSCSALPILKKDQAHSESSW